MALGVDSIGMSIVFIGFNPSREQLFADAQKRIADEPECQGVVHWRIVQLLGCIDRDEPGRQMFKLFKSSGIPHSEAVESVRSVGMELRSMFPEAFKKSEQP